MNKKYSPFPHRVDEITVETNSYTYNLLSLSKKRYERKIKQGVGIRNGRGEGKCFY